MFIKTPGNNLFTAAITSIEDKYQYPIIYLKNSIEFSAAANFLLDSGPPSVFEQVSLLRISGHRHEINNSFNLYIVSFNWSPKLS